MSSVGTVVASKGKPYFEGYEEDVCERSIRVVIAAVREGAEVPLLKEDANPWRAESWSVVPEGMIVLYNGTVGPFWDTDGPVNLLEGVVSPEVARALSFRANEWRASQ